MKDGLHSLPCTKHTPAKLHLLRSFFFWNHTVNCKISTRSKIFTSYTENVTRKARERLSWNQHISSNTGSPELINIKRIIITVFRIFPKVRFTDFLLKIKHQCFKQCLYSIVTSTERSASFFFFFSRWLERVSWLSKFPA